MIRHDYKHLANKPDDKPNLPEWLQLIWAAGVMAVVLVGWWSGL
jgi:hypothetical protein